MNSKIVLLVYRPLQGKEKDPETIVSKHLHVLRSQDLITDRDAVVMRAANGCCIEEFEWKSQEAIDAAHHNQEILKLWDEFSKVCKYERPANVAEFHNLFSEFQPI